MEAARRTALKEMDLPYRPYAPEKRGRRHL